MLLTAYIIERILVTFWEVEYTNEFEEWWDRLDASEQDSVDVVVGEIDR